MLNSPQIYRKLTDYQLYSYQLYSLVKIFRFGLILDLNRNKNNLKQIVFLWPWSHFLEMSLTLWTICWALQSLIGTETEKLRLWWYSTVVSLVVNLLVFLWIQDSFDCVFFKASIVCRFAVYQNVKVGWKEHRSKHILRLFPSHFIFIFSAGLKFERCVLKRNFVI